MYAIDRPSCDHAGFPIREVWSDTLDISPPAAGTVQTSSLVLYCPSSRLAANTMRVPSGDQRGDVSSRASPFVSCVAAPEATSSTQICGPCSSKNPAPPALYHRLTSTPPSPLPPHAP